MRDKYTEGFQEFEGERDGNKMVGLYDEELLSEEDKGPYVNFYEITIHIGEPVFELEPGDDGIANEAERTEAFKCREKALAAISKAGSFKYVGHYFWHRQFIMVLYLTDDEANAITNSMNPLIEESTCVFATAYRGDPEWESAEIFLQS